MYVQHLRILAKLIKQQANHMFWLGDVEAAVKSYTEALDTCPLKHRKERMVLYSNRAQCCCLEILKLPLDTQLELFVSPILQILIVKVCGEDLRLMT